MKKNTHERGEKKHEKEDRRKEECRGKENRKASRRDHVGDCNVVSRPRSVMTHFTAFGKALLSAPTLTTTSLSLSRSLSGEADVCADVFMHLCVLLLSSLSSGLFEEEAAASPSVAVSSSDLQIHFSCLTGFFLWYMNHANEGKWLRCFTRLLGLTCRKHILLICISLQWVLHNYSTKLTPSDVRCTVFSLLMTFDMLYDIKLCSMGQLIGVFTTCRWSGRLVCASWVWQHRQHIWGEGCFIRILICSQVHTLPQVTLLMLDSFAHIVFSHLKFPTEARRHSAMSLPGLAECL